MYKVAWSRVKRHQSPRVLWASCKQEPMESMALVPPTLLALAYVGVFLIKSQYIKQNQSTNLFTARGQSYVGEAFPACGKRGKKIHLLWNRKWKFKPWENKGYQRQKAVSDREDSVCMCLCVCVCVLLLLELIMCWILIKRWTQAENTRASNENANLHVWCEAIQMKTALSAQASWRAAAPSADTQASQTCASQIKHQLHARLWHTSSRKERSPLTLHNTRPCVIFPPIFPDHINNFRHFFPLCLPLNTTRNSSGSDRTAITQHHM